MNFKLAFSENKKTFCTEQIDGEIRIIEVTEYSDGSVYVEFTVRTAARDNKIHSKCYHSMSSAKQFDAYLRMVS